MFEVLRPHSQSTLNGPEKLGSMLRYLGSQKAAAADLGPPFVSPTVAGGNLDGHLELFLEAN